MVGALTTLLEDLRAQRTVPAFSDLRGLSAATKARLAEHERATIERALRESNASVSAAAKRLGIARVSLYRRLYAYGLAEPRARA